MISWQKPAAACASRPIWPAYTLRAGGESRHAGKAARRRFPRGGFQESFREHFPEHFPCRPVRSLHVERKPSVVLERAFPCRRDRPRRLGAPGAGRSPLPQRRFPVDLRAPRPGRPSLRLVGAASRGARCARPGRRPAAALPAPQLAWRFRQRLVLGGGLPATRPQLLPEAAHRPAAYAGRWAAPPGRARRAGRGRPPAADRRSPGARS